MPNKRATRILALFAALFFAGCAHTHIGDCASCTGFVLVQDKVHDDVQTNAIFTEVGRVLKASVAPVRSKP